MTNAPKKPKRDKIKEAVFAIEPWECRHSADRSELLANIERQGKKKVVAVVAEAGGVSAATLANFICFAINDYQKRKTALNNAIGALDLLLSEGINFSSEQEAERAITTIEKEIGGAADYRSIRKRNAARKKKPKKI